MKIILKEKKTMKLSHYIHISFYLVSICISAYTLFLLISIGTYPEKYYDLIYKVDASNSFENTVDIDMYNFTEEEKELYCYVAAVIQKNQCD
jgi:hypothetical protein